MSQNIKLRLISAHAEPGFCINTGIKEFIKEICIYGVIVNPVFLPQYLEHNQRPCFHIGVNYLYRETFAGFCIQYRTKPAGTDFCADIRRKLHYAYPVCFSRRKYKDEPALQL